MQIEINDKRKVFAIKEEFRKLFPYLKLEFFSKPHKLGGTPAKKFINSDRKTLGECRTIHDHGKITITPHMTASGLEERFGDIYGLGVRVFVKFENTEVETTGMDNWALEKLNKHGESLSKDGNQ